jgi:hypothetical protein
MLPIRTVVRTAGAIGIMKAYDTDNDYQAPSARRRRMNGGWAGETLRWVVGLLLAGVVSYYTTVGSMKYEIGVLEERENNHYSELLRRLDRIERKMDDQRDYGFSLSPRP